MKQDVTNCVVFPSDEVWHRSVAAIDLQGRGNPDCLASPLTAFFASRECPGTAIRMAMDWALQQARLRQPLVGGFHSPLERSVLELLLEAGSPVVVVLARPAASARLNRSWRDAIRRGHLSVVSATEGLSQLTGRQAATRNEVVARLAASIVIAHVRLGGCLARQKMQWQDDNKQIKVLGKH